MVQKRQLAEEEFDVSPKHLKLDHSRELVPFLQFTSEDVPLHSDKDEGCFSKPIIRVDSGFASGKFTDLPVCTTKDVDYTLSGSLSTLSRVSNVTSEEDARSEAPFQIPDYCPLKPRTLIPPEDTYSYLLGYPPLKEAPIGPEYQANIPEWHGYDAMYSSKTSNLPQTSEAHHEDEIKFIGSCVIPMPDDDHDDDDDVIERGRTDCYYRDPGSLRSVQQHINEARETLKRKIGHERFEELGFGNMGEVVADKWTEEDEQLFHEVVYSNPASFGKNFWDHLAAEFPSRTNQEIVSYYFNVFVLRRRAEQNRCDPTSADSDDDEWQGSEADEYSSHIENPIMDHHHNRSRNISETQSLKLVNSCSFDSSRGDGDHDFQDDSCTSSDSKSWGNHEFIFEPSDSKVWDVGYFSSSRSKNDFLPTGSMIEEVFGVGSWNFDVTDDDDKGSN